MVDGAARAAAEATRCIALRSRRLSRLVTKLFEDALRDQEITVAQFSLLGATVLESPLRPARLARLLDLEKSTLSRNLRLLEAAGLLRIEGGPGGAGQMVQVSERGRRALVRALPAWKEAQRRVIGAMGDVVVGRLDAMIEALGKDPPTENQARGRFRRSGGGTLPVPRQYTIRP